MLIFINNYYLRRRHIDAVVTYVLRSSAHAIGQQNNGKQILSGVFFFFSRTLNVYFWKSGKGSALQPWTTELYMLRGVCIKNSRPRRPCCTYNESVPTRNSAQNWAHWLTLAYTNKDIAKTDEQTDARTNSFVPSQLYAVTRTKKKQRHCRPGSPMKITELSVRDSLKSRFAQLEVDWATWTKFGRGPESIEAPTEKK